MRMLNFCIFVIIVIKLGQITNNSRYLYKIEIYINIFLLVIINMSDIDEKSDKSEALDSDYDDNESNDPTSDIEDDPDDIDFDNTGTEDVSKVDDEDSVHSAINDSGQVIKSSVSDDDTEENSSDEDEYRKLSHIESTIHNLAASNKLNSLEEITHLLKIERNHENIIIDKYHRTTPILTKFEKAKVIGLRSMQLSNGLEPFITIDPHIIDPLTIADMELRQKKIPFIIKRPISNTIYEYWYLYDLEVLI